MRFSLIIPTYNEAQNIAILLERVEAQLRGIDYEVIVVDDDSRDGTGRVVEEYRLGHPRVVLAVRRGERGLSGAVLHGFEMAKGDALAVMDGDLSHDERLLPAMARAIEAGADLAVGSRRIPGGGADHWPWYRRFTSDVATRLAFLGLNLSLSDPMSGFFALKRSVYDACKTRLTAQGYKILLEIYCLARPPRVVELPFIFKDRKQGHSKLTPRVMWQFLHSLCRLRLRRHIAKPLSFPAKASLAR